MKKRLIAATTVSLILFQPCANAQSTVTLYGAIDDGLDYISNVGGKPLISMVSGELVGTRWGMKGIEDLGGGFKAIFVLENGFNVNNGKLGSGGLEFGRLAYVGLDHQDYGTLNFGRAADASHDVWNPYTAAGSAIGDAAAHPLDNDNSDTFFRVNNVAKYVSPLLHGFQFVGSYAMSNSTNFADNREYSVAGSYNYGQLSGAASFTRASNPSSATNPNGAISPTYAFGFLGSAYQNINAGVRWTFSGSNNVALAYSHVDVYATPDGTIKNFGFGVTASGQDSWKFDNFELNGQYFFTPALSIAAAYTFTHAGIHAAQYASATWHQGSALLNYSLSKRTSVYFMGGYQHANDVAAAQLGTNIAGLGRSSSQNQALGRFGLVHKF